MLWISTEDLATVPQKDDAASLRVLEMRPGRSEVSYTMTEYTFGCRVGSVYQITWTVWADGEGEEPEAKPGQGMKPGTLEGELFSIACRGGAPLTDIEVGTIREALDYDAMARERGWNPSLP